MTPSQFDIREICHADPALFFPGALGDFLCFAPALFGLRAETQSRLLVVARPSWTRLLDPQLFDFSSIDGRAVAELFGAGSLAHARRQFGAANLIHSWTGIGDPSFRERLTAINGARVEVYAFRDFRTEEHAVDYYARCLGVAAAPVAIYLPAHVRSWADQALAGLPTPILAIHAGSGSPAKNWLGFPAVTSWWQSRGGSVVELRGPAEASTPRLDTDRTFDVELTRVAALLQRVSFYLGNDSGITHLAGVLAVDGVALFLKTNIAHWRPRSATLIAVEADDECMICGAARLCLHRMPVSRVTAALDKAAAGLSAISAGSADSRSSSDR